LCQIETQEKHDALTNVSRVKIQFQLGSAVVNMVVEKKVGLHIGAQVVAVQNTYEF
jgi:hypothetical protein